MSVLLANDIDLYDLIKNPSYVTTAINLGEILRTGRSLIGNAPAETASPATETATETRRTSKVDRTSNPEENAQSPAQEKPASTRTAGFTRTTIKDVEDLGYDEKSTALIESFRDAVSTAKKFKVSINGDEKVLPGIPVYSEMPKARTFQESLQTESDILEGFGSGYHNPPSLYDKDGNLIISDKTRSLSPWRTSDYYTFSNGKFVKNTKGKSVYFNKVKLYSKDGYPPFVIDHGKDLFLAPFKASETAPRVNPKFIRDAAPVGGASTTLNPPKERTPRPRVEPIPAPVTPAPTIDRRRDFTPNIDADLNWDDLDEKKEAKRVIEENIPTPVIPAVTSPRVNRVVEDAPKPAITRTIDEDSSGPSLRYDPKYQGPASEIGDKVIVKVLESILSRKSLEVKDILELAMESTEDAHLQRLLECMIDRLDGASPKDYIRSVERSINGFFHLKFSR
jgi:hypothetical protein